MTTTLSEMQPCGDPHAPWRTGGDEGRLLHREFPVDSSPVSTLETCRQP
jgi:hypothetical protein